MIDHQAAPGDEPNTEPNTEPQAESFKPFGQIDESGTYSGLVSIVGRPNVGKSTLLNYLVGKKLSITASKAQTTRHRIHGVLTEGEHQMVFIDTPGLHIKPLKALGRFMNKEAKSALAGVDIVLWLLDRLRWNSQDQYMLQLLKHYPGQLIIALNKADGEDQRAMLPQAHALYQRIQKECPKLNLISIMPLSALKGTGVDQLISTIKTHLPASPFYYDKDQLSNRGEKFFLAELVREQLVRLLGQELPYATTVQVAGVKHETTKQGEPIAHVDVYIICERKSQKPIILGEGGERIKQLSSQARQSLEQYLGTKVMLQAWVKTMPQWNDQENLLQKLGYQSE